MAGRMLMTCETLSPVAGSCGETVPPLPVALIALPKVKVVALVGVMVTVPLKPAFALPSIVACSVAFPISRMSGVVVVPVAVTPFPTVLTRLSVVGLTLIGSVAWNGPSVVAVFSGLSPNSRPPLVPL